MLPCDLPPFIPLTLGPISNYATIHTKGCQSATASISMPSHLDSVKGIFHSLGLDDYVKLVHAGRFVEKRAKSLMLHLCNKVENVTNDTSSGNDSIDEVYASLVLQLNCHITT